MGDSTPQLNLATRRWEKACGISFRMLSVDINFTYIPSFLFNKFDNLKVFNKTNTLGKLERVNWRASNVVWTVARRVVTADRHSNQLTGRKWRGARNWKVQRLCGAWQRFCVRLWHDLPLYWPPLTELPVSLDYWDQMTSRKVLVT